MSAFGVYKYIYYVALYAHVCSSAISMDRRRYNEWSTMELWQLTPAKVLLQSVYLLSQTNFILLFLLRSLEDQELNSSVSFI